MQLLQPQSRKEYELDEVSAFSRHLERAVRPHGKSVRIGKSWDFAMRAFRFHRTEIVGWDWLVRCDRYLNVSSVASWQLRSLE